MIIFPLQLFCMLRHSYYLKYIPLKRKIIQILRNKNVENTEDLRSVTIKITQYIHKNFFLSLTNWKLIMYLNIVNNYIHKYFNKSFFVFLFKKLSTVKNIFAVSKLKLGYFGIIKLYVFVFTSKSWNFFWKITILWRYDQLICIHFRHVITLKLGVA